MPNRLQGVAAFASFTLPLFSDCVKMSKSPIFPVLICNKRRALRQGKGGDLNKKTFGSLVTSAPPFISLLLLRFLLSVLNLPLEIVTDDYYVGVSCSIFTRGLGNELCIIGDIDSVVAIWS